MLRVIAARDEDLLLRTSERAKYREIVSYHLREVMYTGELEEGGDAVTETHQQEPIQSSGVSNFW